MSWRQGWWCAVILVVGILGCSGGDTHNNLTGTWTGPIQDSRAGRGMLLIHFSHRDTQLTGTWQQTFADPCNTTGGTLTGTASGSFDVTRQSP